MEKPCETYDKLLKRGVPVSSEYMMSLKQSCDQTALPDPFGNGRNYLKIAGISLGVIGLIVAIILIIKQK